MKRRIIALILALAICLGLFSGCMSDSGYTPALELSRDEPPKQGEGTLASGEFEASLYFVNEDGTRLVCEKRTISCGEGESMALCTVEALLEGPDTPSYQYSVSPKLKLEKVEQSMNICNVYLDGGFPGDESEWLTARLAIAATLKDTLGIEAINLLYNNKEQGYNSHAVGEARYSGESLDAYLEDMAEQYSGYSGEIKQYINQYVTLYFTNADCTLIAAYSTEIAVSPTVDVTNVVSMLTEKLAAGVLGDSNLEPVLPADFSLAEEPRIGIYGMEDYTAETTDEGQNEGSNETSTEDPSDDETDTSTSTTQALPLYAPKVIYLTIREPGGEYDERLLCASLTLTLTGYLPGMSGIVLYMQREDGTKVQLMSENDYITRDLFSDMLGTSVPADCPDESGTLLTKQSEIVPSADADDLTKRVLTLIDAQSSSGLGFAPLSKEDVERVYLSDGTAVIEWKEGTSEKLKAALEGEENADRLEMLIIYSFVNTLTEIPYIKKVWMSEGGQKMGLINNIYLGNALLRSPGLMNGD